MSEAKHTPGPWHIGMNPGPFIYGPKGEEVARVNSELNDAAENRANAALIARAPDLLADNERLAEAVLHEAKLFESASKALDRCNSENERLREALREIAQPCIEELDELIPCSAAERSEKV